MVEPKSSDLAFTLITDDSNSYNKAISEIANISDITYVKGEK